ncbi:ankyrin repeat domain-containing protein [Aspergillus mulundensis]|uniref:F-box domain-containing protein n=1 Tax=Aspergillus mulundensis TaxID=1810919 RepID=A0A3D8T4G6_9EURO|nr:hypothetical protein DSM5745_00767 [Aspergillus mulundensis]RDW93445.1 hypothetical protein DSM5745_00767 [Aspergillus mulundensis]
MSLMGLPNELLLDIAEFIEAEKDLSSFVRTCVRVNNVISGYLYLNNVRKHNNSALHWASSFGMIETARKSISQGGDVNETFDGTRYKVPLRARGAGNQSPTADAGQNGNVVYDSFQSMMELLLFCKKSTPLIQAVLRMDCNFIKFILEAGADPNVKAHDGYTGLLLLTRWQPNLTALKLLLEHGADPNLTSNYRTSPIELAVSDNHEDIVRLLLEYGADKHFVDARGMTPLEIAMKRGHNKIADMLRD